jgi:hypothetical protein
MARRQAGLTRATDRSAPWAMALASHTRTGTGSVEFSGVGNNPRDLKQTRSSSRPGVLRRLAVPNYIDFQGVALNSVARLILVDREVVARRVPEGCVECFETFLLCSR